LMQSMQRFSEKLAVLTTNTELSAPELALKYVSSQEFGHDHHRRNAFFAFWATSRIRIGLGYTKPSHLFSHQSVKRETISD